MVEELPPYLYHYTTPTGLQGILKTGKLWASDARYLNDLTETLQLAISGIGYLNGLISQAEDAEHEQAITEIRRQLSALAASHDDDLGTESSTYLPFRPYVASFSTLADDLAQWRAYSPPSGGFAIGFRTDLLRASGATQGFKLLKCTYIQESGDESVEQLIDGMVGSLTSVLRYIAELRREDPDSDSAFYIGKNLGTTNDVGWLIGSEAARYKHAAFKGECEWRMVSPDTEAGLTSPPVLARVALGRHPLVPYVELDLDFAQPPDRPSISMPMVEVWVGPTNHPKLALEAVQTLLRQHQPLWTHKVQASMSPYRP
jgi:hypothetical protein